MTRCDSFQHRITLILNTVSLIFLGIPKHFVVFNNYQSMEYLKQKDTKKAKEDKSIYLSLAYEHGTPCKMQAHVLRPQTGRSRGQRDTDGARVFLSMT